MACEAAGVVNQVGLVLRSSPAFLELKHQIDDPRSGRVQAVVLRDDQFLPVQGMYGSTWRADPSQGGSGHDARALDPRRRRPRVAAGPGRVGQRPLEHLPRQPGDRGHGRGGDGDGQRRPGEPHQRVAPAPRAAEPASPRGDLRARVPHRRARRDRVPSRGPGRASRGRSRAASCSARSPSGTTGISPNQDAGFVEAVASGTPGPHPDLRTAVRGPRRGRRDLPLGRRLVAHRWTSPPIRERSAA